VFQYRVLRKIVYLTRDEVKLECKRLNNQYISPNIVRCSNQEEKEIGSACGMNGGQERCIEGFCREN